jgi:plasmid stabilization system protein ParE
MREPVFSPMALEDLEGILQYVARDKPAAAVSFVETLKDKCNTLARFPLLGAPRAHLAEGLRVFPVAAMSSTIVGKEIRYESSVFSMELATRMLCSAMRK